MSDTVNIFKKYTKPYRLWASPHVGVAVKPFYEQVLNGRVITSNNTACQPILWIKPIKDWDELLRYGKLKNNDQKEF